MPATATSHDQLEGPGAPGTDRFPDRQRAGAPGTPFATVGSQPRHADAPDPAGAFSACRFVGAERLDDELGDPPRLLDGSEVAGSRNDDKPR